MRPDPWGVGGPYQAFMGRWSSMVAAQFVPWTGVSPRGLWVDIGCGTGMLSQAILSLADPQAVMAIDPFEGFLRHARTAAQDRRLICLAGTGGALPIAQGAVDAVVSGLVLNFLERPRLALQRMADACRPGGVVAGYVWDYAGRMEMLRYFWDAAAFLDPEARDLDEGQRFPLCRPEALESVFLESGLTHVAVHSIEIRTQFRNLDDYWEPYLGGVGPAPGYVAGLRPRQREALKDRLRATLPVGSRGQIDLVGRAWAVKGQVWASRASARENELIVEPKIISSKPFLVAGMKYRGGNENEEIPQLWRDFWPRHTEIQNRVAPGLSYGVITNFDEEAGEFDYIAGVQVQSGSELPTGMVAIELPGQTYAVFECTLPALMPTMSQIYERWLPASDYRRAPGPEFELYDERFDPDHNRFEMSVCIPVVRK